MRTKLLLADDSITIQKVVGIIFASEDYELAIVDNGTAALSKAREFVPDLLLVDAVMPGKSGYEVCEEARRDPVLKGVPILLLTGAFEPFDNEKARQCGADDFISKPFESQLLTDKVTELVELGRKRASAASAPVPKAAAPAVQVQPGPVMPAAAPRPPQSAQDIASPAVQTVVHATDIFTREAEPAQMSSAAATPAAAPDFEFEMVEGTAEDDIWGAFDLEDVAEGEPAVFEESPFEVEPLAEGGSVLGEAFGFADEAGTAAPVSTGATEGSAALWETGDSSAFSFAEETPPDIISLSAEPEEFLVESAGSVPSAPVESKPYAPPVEQEFDLRFAPEEDFMPAPESLEPPAPSPSASVDSEFDFQFASGEEFVPAEESVTAFTVSPFSVSAPLEEAREPIFAPQEEFVPAPETLAPAAAPAASAPAPFAAEPTLSEEQMAALVSRISRDIIEKIAWEVVPDLAETIIKEEIRKIKEGV